MINKYYFCIVFIFAFILNAFASDIVEESIEQEKTKITPVLFYEHALMDDGGYRAPGAAVIIAGGDRDLPFRHESSGFFLGALYKQYTFSDMKVPDYSDTYHDIEMLLKQRYERHYFILFFESYAQRPVVSGLQSLSAAIGYGFDLVQKNNYSISLGCMIGVSDYGIDLPDGRPIPVLPFPVARFTANYSWLKITYEFVMKSFVNFEIAPQKQIRMTGYLRMDRYTGIRDLLFDCALWYRFFPVNYKFGDFAGIAVGMKNDGRKFALPTKDKSFTFSQYSSFVKLDLSVLQLTCGYIFSGSETYIDGNEKIKMKTGEGWWASVQAAYRF